ncbi:uncharacterized protein zgc:113279 isoform X1 [Synchiropus splendidus]|uniref:uncharacterized protein zgc:113279 isoform X1 n=1 Tax=Synchiropus splendidus TaxID=270530 RepID=UPI00237E4361|nr:uncharacterized protein zgc:113279 isoform X1 [Synchiropus splendidus]
MRGRYKRDKTGDMAVEARDSDAGFFVEPNTPVVREAAGGRKASKRSTNGNDKVYLGVRVKMPVKDLLKNIRQAQGWESQGLKELCSKGAKGEKKRVKTRACRQTTKKKVPTKSLEELAIIVEVLEEDLRSSHTECSNPQSASFSAYPGTGYNSDEAEEMIPSPGSDTTYSPECHQALSPAPDFLAASCQLSNIDPYHERDTDVDYGILDDLLSSPNPSWSHNHSGFFWAQLQKEESQLRDVSDAALVAVDEHGQTALHRVVCGGKRARAYAIARRMAAIGRLDVKDFEGMTALLHAANHNQHLMVEDLIRLGADVNESSHAGKSCLHLSAEKGYIRVLEVLKHAMMDGWYVDVEATDISGMSVMQCASLSLKATLHELEVSRSPNETRLYQLRKEQIMETLECLLQMDSFCHTMVGGFWITVERSVLRCVSDKKRV